jgi:hypothetical protein
LDVAELTPAAASPGLSLEAGGSVVRDTPRLVAATRQLVEDGGRRRTLHSEIARLVSHGDEVLGRWAAVMLNAEAYAEVVERHVELVSDVVWLGNLLDHHEPAVDVGRGRKARSSAAVQLEGVVGNEWLTQRVVVITQLAEELDRNTPEVALRIVPVQWWEARLGTSVPAELRTIAVPEA